LEVAMRLPVILALCLAAISAPAAAQDLTDDQLLELFHKQRDAFRAATSSGMGKTRGLTLVTVDPVAGAGAPAADQGGVTALTTDPAATQPSGGGDATGAVSVTADPSVTTTAPTGLATADQATDTAPQPVVFGDLAPDLQVNVKIRFAFDSAALTPDQKPLLDQLCKVMSGSDIRLFRIVGHTDASGTDAYNRQLSQLRADEVRRYMTDTCGIDPARLEALGLGEEFLADKDDPDAAENRRVEFQALS
jgi:OmpA-OmpF porin, OOP family